MQQGSPLLRRTRLRNQERPWETIPTLFQQTPPPQHQPAPTLMVEMNQVPVSLPLRHEPIWTYQAGPHLSISSLCSNHPPPTHISPCQVHGMYSQTFAQTCSIGNHYCGFTSTPAQIAVPQPHQPHYQHAHIAQQVKLIIFRRSNCLVY